MTMTSIALDQPLHLVALDRPQLEDAHAKMTAWVVARIDRIDHELDVEGAALDAAARSGFATSPFERRLNQLARQRTFFEKIRVAVEAGYAIVPNFPMTIFAIRTKAKTLKGAHTTSAWNRQEQSAQLLGQGDGEYRSPLPVIDSYTNSEPDGKGGTKQVTNYYPSEWADEIEFPLALARPEIMDKTRAAMTMKLFDEIGVADDRSGQASGGRGDPVIIGRIRNPRRGGPALSFFIAWYFDPSHL
jgi:hypothetical protein